MEGLRQVFLDFTSFGAGQAGSSEMDSAKFVKLCKVSQTRQQGLSIVLEPIFALCTRELQKGSSKPQKWPDSRIRNKGFFSLSGFTKLWPRSFVPKWSVVSVRFSQILYGPVTLFSSKKNRTKWSVNNTARNSFL